MSFRDNGGAPPRGRGRGSLVHLTRSTDYDESPVGRNSNYGRAQEFPNNYRNNYQNGPSQWGQGYSYQQFEQVNGSKYGSAHWPQTEQPSYGHGQPLGSPSHPHPSQFSLQPQHPPSSQTTSKFRGSYSDTPHPASNQISSENSNSQFPSSGTYLVSSSSGATLKCVSGLSKDAAKNDDHKTKELRKQQASSGKQQASSGKRQASSGKQQASSGKQQASSAKQQASSGKQQASSGKQQASSVKQQASSGKPQVSNGKQRGSDPFSMSTLESSLEALNEASLTDNLREQNFESPANQSLHLAPNNQPLHPASNQSLCLANGRPSFAKMYATESLPHQQAHRGFVLKSTDSDQDAQAGRFFKDSIYIDGNLARMMPYQRELTNCPLHKDLIANILRKPNCFYVAPFHRYLWKAVIRASGDIIAVDKRPNSVEAQYSFVVPLCDKLLQSPDVIKKLIEEQNKSSRSGCRPMNTKGPKIVIITPSWKGVVEMKVLSTEVFGLIVTKISFTYCCD